ncbi:hypothetical protein [Halovivax sp.]|uniref:hypothetical protein n=1 Tax=Halovivax sp. TaxID=1935978 RepID=UPI0025B909EC|nr:hypothetical protein [Halovivax sp.]
MADPEEAAETTDPEAESVATADESTDDVAVEEESLDEEGVAESTDARTEPESTDEQPTTESGTVGDASATSSGRSLARAQRAMGTLTILGLWIFWSPILFTGYGWEIYTNVFLGLAIVVAGCVAVVKKGGDSAAAVGLPALAAALAIATIGVTFLMGYGTTLLVWSNVITGSLLVVLAALAIVAYNKSGDRPSTNRAATAS